MDTPSDSPRKAASGPDLTGSQIGDYRLLRRLGHGAMAEVYLAEQCSLKRRVAFKVLRDELTGDETYVKRFRREAEAAASLIHANIVQIHEVGCVDGVYFIAQEYVEGQNLSRWIARHDRPDLPHALSVMRQVAAALAKAAAHGIIHRDIKPENILLTRSGEVKVADFGLARWPRQDDGVELTRVGVTLGTPLYMSPEQVEGRSLDPRSDLYSFGVTCYHLLTGAPPFTGQTPLSVAVQHLKKEPQPLASVRSDLPAELCRVIHKMLAKDPKNRHQSARDLLQELRQLQRDELGDEWPDSLPGWETTGPEEDTLGPIQATQRIQAVMDTAAMAARGRWRGGALIASMLAACVAGGLLAWWTTRPVSIIAGAAIEAAAPVPRQKSVQLQTIQAARLGTLAAWQAVIDNYPDQQYYVCWAKQQIARIHLLSRDFGEALPLFRELAEFDPANRRLRAFGLAGQAVVLTHQKKYKRSAEILKQLAPLNADLKDDVLRQAVKLAAQRNASEIAPPAG
ncbi:MAG: serine/threonine protein kinase [Pirellulales bacterium]|nr:serine/threonine protein kinase [Pirellulales bacterium]